MELLLPVVMLPQYYFEALWLYYQHCIQIWPLLTLPTFLLSSPNSDDTIHALFIQFNNFVLLVVLFVYIFVIELMYRCFLFIVFELTAGSWTL